MTGKRRLCISSSKSEQLGFKVAGLPASITPYYNGTKPVMAIATIGAAPSSFIHSKPYSDSQCRGANRNPAHSQK